MKLFCRKTIMLVAAATLAATVAVAQQKAAYTVTGEVNDPTAEGRMIYIERYDNHKYIDSTRITGGKFVFVDSLTDLVSVASRPQHASTQTSFWRAAISRQVWGVSFIPSRRALL